VLRQECSCGCLDERSVVRVTGGATLFVFYDRELEQDRIIQDFEMVRKEA